jgi:hypothetical protein
MTRPKATEEEKRAQNRERVRRFRDRQKSGERLKLRVTISRRHLSVIDAVARSIRDDPPNPEAVLEKLQ